jgi:hypothetical protein
MAFSLVVNCANRVDTTYWRNYGKLLWLEGVTRSWSAHWIHKPVNLGFLDRMNCFRVLL